MFISGEIRLIRGLWKGVFERPTSTGSGLFAVLGSGFAQVFGKIVSKGVKTLGNTKFCTVKAYSKGKRPDFRLTCVAQKPALCSSARTYMRWKSSMSSISAGVIPPDTNTNALSCPGISFFREFSSLGTTFAFSSSWTTLSLMCAGQQIRWRTSWE